MTTLTVTAKGQVTLKKDVLQHLGARPGDKVDVNLLPGGRIEMSGPRRMRQGNLADLSGILKRPGQQALTIEEINEAIADGWAGIKR
jgi:antitoxin PrlF